MNVRPCQRLLWALAFGWVTVGAYGSTHNAVVNIAEGRTEVTGDKLSMAREVWVRDGAWIGGSGTIGGGLLKKASDERIHAVLHIQSGAVLDATPRPQGERGNSALRVIGDLNLHPGSLYRVILENYEEEVTPLTVVGTPGKKSKITIGGDLQLLLTATPAPLKRVILVADQTSSDKIQGRFTSINEIPLKDGEDEIILHSASDEMDFCIKIIYHPDSIALRLLSNKTTGQVYATE